jgi:hypothetical protein
MKTTETRRNRAKDFVLECGKRFRWAIEQAASDYIVKVSCSTGTRDCQVNSMAPVGNDFITFQSSDETTETMTIAPLEQVSVHLRVTKRKAKEKQLETNFNKEMGFHKFTSIKAR